MPCVREVLTMQKLEQLIDKNFAETAHGKVANYIPILEIVDPQQLGIAIYDVDEDEIGTAGMAGTRFAIESIAKVITLILAIKRLGHKRVLAELENGSADYSLSSVLLDDELTEQVHRVNYLNNSSALLTTALIDQLMGQNSFNALPEDVRVLFDNSPVSFWQSIGTPEFASKISELDAKVKKNSSNSAGTVKSPVGDSKANGGDVSEQKSE